ncbi:MAG: patatin-like phospholipase family protein [Paracoccaceae bacterium]
MVKRINVALQGGGAHGAFTWGVLDRLLDEKDIEIAGISGTSAGALNGAALKAGMIHGGRTGAQENLDWLWGKIGAVDNSLLTSWMAGSGPAAVSHALEHSLPYMMIDTWTRMVSPYSYGPFYTNPLRTIVDEFDYECIACIDEGPELFICATRVRNGKVRVFKGEDITTDAILASACLPTMFRAVEFFDTETKQVEAFWDGGYTGNPALFPLFEGDLPDDIVIVNINPLERKEVPRTPQQIQNRINEVSFNSSLLRELRAIGFVQRLLTEGKLKPGEMNRVLVHMIADDELMNELSVATKTLPNPYILNELKKAGQQAAERFLSKHKSALNEQSTIKLEDMFN